MDPKPQLDKYHSLPTTKKDLDAPMIMIEAIKIPARILYTVDGFRLLAFGYATVYST